MHPSVIPRLSNKNVQIEKSDAAQTDVRTGSAILLTALSRALWSPDAFLRSRIFAFCVGLAALPFLVVLGQEKSLQILIVVNSLLLPPLTGLIVETRFGLLRALQVQFCISGIMAFWGMLSGFGVGAPLAMLAFSVIDFLVFMPRAKIVKKQVYVASAMLVIICIFVMARAGAAQLTLFYAPSFMALAAIFAQILTGLLQAPKQDENQVPNSNILNAVQKLVLQNSNDFAVILDNSGRVLSTSGDANRVIGSDADSLSGRGLFERLHPVDRSTLLMACGKLGNISRIHEFPLRLSEEMKGNTTLPLNYKLFSARVCEIEDSKTDSLLLLREVSLAQDCDYNVQKSASPSMTTEQTQQRSKLLQELSHDVRTPFNAIIGFAELLSDPSSQPKSPGAIAEYGQIIHRSSKDLLGVVNDLVDMTRIEHGLFKMLPEIVAPHDVISLLNSFLAEKFDGSDIKIKAAGSLHDVDWSVDKRAACQVIGTMALALIEQSHTTTLRVDVSVVNNTICIGLSCPEAPQAHKQIWQFPPVSGLALSVEVAKTLAIFMNGEAELKHSQSGWPIAEVQFSLDGAVNTDAEGELVHLKKFIDERRKSVISLPNPLVKKHA